MINIYYTGNATKLSKLLMDYIPSYNLICKLIRSKDIVVNGKKIKEDMMININDDITVYYSPMKLNVVYQDDNIIVIDKPKGVPSIGENSVNTMLAQQFDTSTQITHRLDTNTDGLIICSKNDTVFEEVKKLFKNNQIIKKYACLVYKTPSQKEGHIELYLSKNEQSGVVKVVGKNDGLYASTRYRVVRQWDNCSLVDISIDTGRTHQIRVAMASIGCPIIGDSKYSTNVINRMFNCSKQQLIAYSITFSNDITGALSSLKGKEISIPYNNRLKGKNIVIN